MLDFHTHLLPAVDDGSRTPEESLELIAALDEFGFDSMVMTPHFYPYKEPMSEFLRRRDEAFSNFEKQVGGKTALYVGCECFMHDYIFNTEDITPLCLQGTQYLLTELSYRAEDGENMLKLIEKLVLAHNVTPVLAHVERYPYIMRDERFFRRFIEIGCLAQVNLQSFSRFFLKKRLADYLNKGYINFLGTDTHRKPFDVDIHEKAVGYLEKCFGADWREEFREIELPTTVYTAK